MPIKKEILYPVFLDCCQHTDDIFWENIFENLAYGKTPYGTYISKNFLCCSYKKKDFSYKIEKKDSKTIYKEVYTLLTKRVGILSHKETSKKRKDFLEIENNIKDSRKNWSEIRKKNVRELLIELYVTRMKLKYFLSIKQVKYLLSIIFFAMVLKVIKSSDIDYVNGSIINIKGIEFKKKQIIITRDLYNIEVNLEPHVLSEKKMMSDNWEKYLDSLRKIKQNS